MVKGRLGVTPYVGEGPASAGTAYRQGDTLVSNIRPYLQKIWLADRDGVCSKDVLVYRSKDTERVLPEFLYILLWQNDFFDYDMSTFTGTGRPRGDKDALLDYRIPVPSTEEQMSVIAEYERLTVSIENCKSQIEDAEEVIRRRFVELFGKDGRSIATRRQFSELIEVINSGTSQRGGSGIALVSPKCITPMVIYEGLRVR